MRKLAITCFTTALALGLLGGTASANSNSRPFKASGSGTETSLSPVGCQFTPGECTIQVNGTATSSHLGTGPFTTTLTILWLEATSNGDGGFCAPASGTSTLYAANGDSVDFTYSGTVCEVGSTGNNVPHTISGKYTIIGGTGRFSGAGGTGTFSGSDDGAGNATMSDSGTISY